MKDQSQSKNLLGTKCKIWIYIKDQKYIVKNKMKEQSKKKEIKEETMLPNPPSKI